MLVEILREQSNYKIKDGKYTCNTLAMQMQCTNEEIKNFINDCCEEFELLQKKDGFIYSESLLRRMEIVDSTSEKRRKASEKRWSNANEMQLESKCNANEMQLESKGKEKKVNEIKEKEIKIQHIIPPKSEWVRVFCEERKNGITADEFIDFYESKGWLIGKTKMKDWQAAIRTWEKNRKVKIEEVKKETKPIKEVKSRYDPLTEEERKMFFDRGAFFIDEDGECVDFSELTEEERIYLHEKGVI